MVGRSIKWASKLTRTLEDDPPAAKAELFAQMSELILKLTLQLMFRSLTEWHTDKQTNIGIGAPASQSELYNHIR